MRQDSVVNKVASPVKFGEYMAAGLPVGITRGVGDYSGAVHTFGLGPVVPICPPYGNGDEILKNWLEGYLKARDATRRRCHKYAEQNLSWDIGTQRLINAYERLCDSR